MDSDKDDIDDNASSNVPIRSQPSLSSTVSPTNDGQTSTSRAEAIRRDVDDAVRIQLDPNVVEDASKLSRTQLEAALEKQRSLYAALETRWDKAKSLLTEVSSQNELLRGEFCALTNLHHVQQLKLLLAEFKASKRRVAVAEEAVADYESREQALVAQREELERQCETLADANDGVVRETEMRLEEAVRACADLRAKLSESNVEKEALVARCDELEKEVEAAADERQRLEALGEQLRSEQSFASSQYESERVRSERLAGELLVVQNSLRDMEQRFLGVGSGGSNLQPGTWSAWLARMRDERQLCMYVGVFLLVTFLLMTLMYSDRATRDEYDVAET